MGDGPGWRVRVRRAGRARRRRGGGAVSCIAEDGRGRRLALSTSFSTTRRGEDALEAVLRAVKHQSIKLQKRPRITPRVPGAGFRPLACTLLEYPPRASCTAAATRSPHAAARCTLFCSSKVVVTVARLFDVAQTVGQPILTWASLPRVPLKRPRFPREGCCAARLQPRRHITLSSRHSAATFLRAMP